MKRRLTAVCLALLISLSFSGCSDGRTEKNSSSDESKLTALPTFSSESELAEFLNEQNAQNYGVAVYSEPNPDMFAKPGYIPDGYLLDEIILAPGSEDSEANLTYYYRSENFLDYDNTVTFRDLATAEADQAYHDFQKQSTLSFNRGPETMSSMPTDGNYFQLYHMVPSVLYPEVYITSSSPQVSKDVVNIAWLDETGHFCALQMPYDLFNEEDIPTYTEVEYFYIDTDNQTMVVAE